MVEYIPISQNLSNVVKHLVMDNNGISLMSEGGDGCTGCEGNCSGSCSGGCKGSCSGSCKGGCKGSCKGECTGSCQTDCENECANACQTICQNGGQTIGTNNNTFPFTWTSDIDKGLTILITATEWNDFATKIEKNAPFCGATCNVVRVSQNNPIYASDFNSLKDNVNKLNPTGISDKISKQSIIEAQDFLILSSKMNEATIKNVTCCELGEYCVEHCNESSGPQYG